MKSLFRIVLSIFVLAGAVMSCAQPGVAEQTDAVNTAVAGTQQAQALAQATVNSTMLTAMPATPTPGPSIEYVTLTEEELAALINQAVAEAVSATEQTTAAVTTTTGDDTLTSEEVVYVYDYYYYADYYVEYAQELLGEYYNLYADLAEEMLTELNAVEQELAQMNETLAQISALLDEINDTLSQGLELAQESIDQLESAAQQAQTNAQELKSQAQDMPATLQLDQEGRLQDISQIQPDNIPTDRIAALQTGFQFIDAAKAALGDDRLSRDELLGLAQLGANAQAGFQNFGGVGDLAGGPDLNQFSGRFNEITNQFARGQLPQARVNLDGFELSLGQRPGGGGGPGPRK